MRTTLTERVPTSFMPADEQVAHLEWQRHMAWVDAQGWKREPRPCPRYRVVLARTLLRVATRIAPTVVPTPQRSDATAH
jgi:hypothetical protein